MAGRTNTDRIEEIGKQVISLSRDIEWLTDEFPEESKALRNDLVVTKKSIDDLARDNAVMQQRIAQLEITNPAQLPVLVQRLNHLDKLLDESRTRRWQVWLAFLSAAMSAIVALVVAFAKK